MANNDSPSNEQMPVTNLNKLLENALPPPPPPPPPPLPLPPLPPPPSGGFARGENGGVDDRARSEQKVIGNFPMVASLVRTRLDLKSRAILQNSKQLQLSSSSSPSPSCSHLYDVRAMLYLLNELMPLVNSQHNPANGNNKIQQHHNLHFVVESVGHVDLLFGEELYRSSRDGSLAPTGRKLEIPRHFNGWFEVLSQDGRSSPQITEVSSLVEKDVRHFVLTRPMRALVRRSETAKLAGDFKQVVLSAGHEMRWTHLLTLVDGDRPHLACRLENFKKKESVEEVLLPLQGQGRFLPVARDGNLTDAHDASFMMSRIHMPVVVRVYWPPGAKNIPQTALTGKPDKRQEAKKMLFHQKRSSSNQRMETGMKISSLTSSPPPPTTSTSSPPPPPSSSSSSPGNCEYLSSTLMRVHGHARQAVLYAAPLMPKELDGSEIREDFKVLALRGQACRFFDVALLNEVKVREEVLEMIRKKRLLVQSDFEREVKIFDQTLYKMNGEKLTVDKQPVRFVDASGKDLADSVTIRQRDRGKRKEEEGGVSKRRSLPQDVLEQATREGADRDDEHLLMNEIENIYMRVRYLDRSVRYPMPQRSKQTSPRRSGKQEGIVGQDHKHPRALQGHNRVEENRQVQKREQIPETAQEGWQKKLQPPDATRPPQGAGHEAPRSRTQTPHLLPEPRAIVPKQNQTPKESHAPGVEACVGGASPDKDLGGLFSVKKALKKLVKKHKGSMDVASPAAHEFSFYRARPN